MFVCTTPCCAAQTVTRLTLKENTVSFPSLEKIIENMCKHCAPGIYFSVMSVVNKYGLYNELFIFTP